MALSKKHFEAIARDIAAEVTTANQSPWDLAQRAAVKVALRNVASNLCTTFRAENPNFDGQRFLKACGF